MSERTIARRLSDLANKGVIEQIGQGLAATLRAEGIVRAIGFSGKDVEGAAAALDWADAIMVEYHLENRAHEPVIAQAAAAGVGVVVKKGLASGHLSPADAIRFVLANPDVSSVLVGSLSLEHLEENVRVAEEVGTEARRHEVKGRGTRDEGRGTRLR